MKTVITINREFKVYNEKGQLISTYKNSKDLIKNLNITKEDLLRVQNTNEYLTLEAGQKIRISFIKTVVTELVEAPFIIPENKVEIIKDLPNEVWKVVPDLPEYNYCSNYGRFKLIDINGNEKFSTLYNSCNKTNRQYQDVALRVDSKTGENYIKVRVSRVLAKTFLDETFPFFYDKKTNLVVDHIDNNSENNNIENLRIITQSENLLLAYSDQGVIGHTKKFKATNVKTNKTLEFKTGSELMRYFNISNPGTLNNYEKNGFLYNKSWKFERV